MTISRPHFSIIMATYNRASFIEETIDSILNQSFFDYELIIVDDGSTDHTEEVLQKYLKDSRLNFYYRPSSFLKGCPGSRNYGLTKARGKYIWFFDDDDLVHPALLDICYNVLKNPDLDFCRFERQVFYDEKDVQFGEISGFEEEDVRTADLKKMIMGRLPFNSCQVIWRRSALGEEHFRAEILYADDWELYSRLIAKGLRGVTLSSVLLFARKHSGSSTAKYFGKDNSIIDSVIQSHCAVIDTAKKKNIIDDELFRFFFRKAVFFRSEAILNYLLKNAEVSPYKHLKYKIGYHLYPILKYYFYRKSRQRSSHKKM